MQLTRTFVFSWHKNGFCKDFQEELVIPAESSAAEVSGFLVEKHSVPCFVRLDLEREVSQFIEAKSEEYFNEQAAETANKLRTDSTRRAAVVKQWVLSQTTPKGRKCPNAQNDVDEFYESYQALLNSRPDSVSLLLQVESRFAKEVQSIVSHRDYEVSFLKNEHDKVMEAAGNCQSDREVNRQAAQLFDNIDMLETEHASKLTALAQAQRIEFRNCILDLHEKHLLGEMDTENDSKPFVSSQREGRNRLSTSDSRMRSLSESHYLEESFTIHLGAQMKTMHNVRLVAMDPMDLCFAKSSSHENPQRLQLALSLYSDRLSAVVLFVGVKPTYHLDFHTDFAKACEKSTDLHFQDLNAQLQEIERNVSRASKWRQLQSATVASESASQNSSPSLSDRTCNDVATDDIVLKPGDVYITRHSNLSQAHVVFHMVGDETLKTQEINSRNWCINGIRNIIRICMRFGVATISLPLLMSYEMTSDMNVSWCLKRAELVFKCVKGFMMECSTLKTNSQYNIQFVLPADIPADTFAQISEMLPNIFRLANPVVAR